MFNPLYRDDDPNGFVHIVFADGLKTSQCDLPGKGLCQQSSGPVYWIPKDLKEVGERVVRIIPKMDVYASGGKTAPAFWPFFKTHIFHMHM